MLNQHTIIDEDYEPFSISDIFNFAPLAQQETTVSPTTVTQKPKISYNSEQLEAVKSIHGPLLIIAGAGSGKTRVLMGRIDEMIENGIDPRSILAITFTNKAAGEMKDRLSPMAQSVTASTIHSLCANILRKYASLLGYKDGFTIYDTDDAKQIIKGIKNDVADNEVRRVRELTPNASDQLYEQIKYNIQSLSEASIASKISKAKSEGVSPGQYSSAMKAFDEQAELTAMLYEAYEIAKFADNAMDFDDLLINTKTLFENHPHTLQSVKNVYKYIMVDEYQDTNHIQNDIVNMMVSATNDICVVGDPDQSIYGWRGAKIENILRFHNQYPQTKVVELKTNYRSIQPILNIANDIINKNPKIENKSRNLVSSLPYDDNDKPKIIQADNGFDEASQIVEEIKKYIDNGGEYKDIAILYRHNETSRTYDNALRNANIPFKIHGGLSFYQRKEIKDMIAYLTVLANPSASLSIKRVINTPERGIGAVTQRRIEDIALGKSPLMIVNQFSQKEESYFNPATSMTTVMLHYLDYIPGLTANHKNGIKSFMDVYTSIDVNSTTMTVQQFIDHVITKTDYLNYLQTKFPNEASDKINNTKEFLSDAKVFDDEIAAQGYTNHSLITRIQLFLQKIMLLTSDTKNNDEHGDNRVTLMTLHASKGLEFPMVCLVKCAQGYLPSDMAIRDGHVDEERRLMYVGVTRAEKRLIISYANEYIKYGQNITTDQSQFLRDINENNVEKIKPKKSILANTNPFGAIFDIDNKPSLTPKRGGFEW